MGASPTERTKFMNTNEDVNWIGVWGVAHISFKERLRKLPYWQGRQMLTELGITGRERRALYKDALKK